MRFPPDPGAPLVYPLHPAGQGDRYGQLHQVQPVHLRAKHREQLAPSHHVFVLVPELPDLHLHLLPDGALQLLVVVDLDTVCLDHQVDVGPVVPSLPQLLPSPLNGP